ncbi:MAG: sigma-70 family RNA polymerase sigma factor [Chitinophagaceae bacterium]|nr:sigma-70 family RNA polymerase sigma factor [Chitinophagaceae bacterium]
MNRDLATYQTDFVELYRQYRPRMLQYVLRRCPYGGQAEDIVQDAFLKLWSIRDTLAGIERLPAYLFVMVRNGLLEYHKKRRLANRLSIQYSHRSSGLTHDHLELKDQLARLLQAVNRLPRQQRLVVELRCEYNWKEKEVAAVLNLSLSTVKNHIQCARRKLRAA